MVMLGRRAFHFWNPVLAVVVGRRNFFVASTKSLLHFVVVRRDWFLSRFAVMGPPGRQKPEIPIGNPKFEARKVAYYKRWDSTVVLQWRRHSLVFSADAVDVKAKSQYFRSASTTEMTTLTIMSTHASLVF